MSDPRFRARVTRLLSNEFRVDDLKTLFLYTRDRCYGSEAVREIGDFIADHDERKKGIVTRSVRDWFTISRYMMPRFMPNTPPIDTTRLPLETPVYLKAAFRRMKDPVLRKQAGLSLKVGKRVLEGLLRRFEPNLDGTIRFTRFIMPEEQKLFQALHSSISTEYAFADKELFEGFRASLTSNKLLMKSEWKDFQRIFEPVTLIAVSAMHNNDIVMDDQSKIRLLARPSRHDGLLQVYASVPIILPERSLYISAPIFGGTIDLADRLSQALLSNEEWDSEIELRDDGKLHQFQ